MRTTDCKHITTNFIVCKPICSLDKTEISEEKCNQCEKYTSRFIEFPITVNSIEVKEDNYDMYASSIGQQCELRLVDEKITHIGTILGELPYMPTVSYNKNSKVVNVSMYKNVAIYVPDLKRVVYGCECWWKKIDSNKQ